MDMTFIIAAIKFFENIGPAADGAKAAGALLASTAQVTIYVVKHGAKILSYLIKRPKSGDKSAPSKQLDISQDDVAIVVDISQPILENVRDYLEKRNIDADVILITNRTRYADKPQFLNIKDESEWEAVVRDFVDVMYQVRRATPGRRIHIFSAAPVPLSFALGAMWGTVQTATLYHWQDDTYNPVIRVTRDIRS